MARQTRSTSKAAAAVSKPPAPRRTSRRQSNGADEDKGREEGAAGKRKRGAAIQKGSGPPTKRAARKEEAEQEQEEVVEADKSSSDFQPSSEESSSDSEVEIVESSDGAEEVEEDQPSTAPKGRGRGRGKAGGTPASGARGKAARGRKKSAAAAAEEAKEKEAGENNNEEAAEDVEEEDGEAAGGGQARGRDARQRGRAGMGRACPRIPARWRGRRNSSSEEDVVDLDEDVATGCEEMMEPPPTVLIPLLPYQKQFLAWAIKQEQGPIKGGILADEMGMGKTIQAISVIMTHMTDDFSHTHITPSAAVVEKPKVQSSLRLSLKPSQAPASDPATVAANAAAPQELSSVVPNPPDAALVDLESAPPAAPSGTAAAADSAVVGSATLDTSTAVASAPEAGALQASAVASIAPAGSGLTSGTSNAPISVGAVVASAPLVSGSPAGGATTSTPSLANTPAVMESGAASSGVLPALPPREGRVLRSSSRVRNRIPLASGSERANSVAVGSSNGTATGSVSGATQSENWTLARSGSNQPMATSQVDSMTGVMGVMSTHVGSTPAGGANQSVGGSGETPAATRVTQGESVAGVRPAPGHGTRSVCGSVGNLSELAATQVDSAGQSPGSTAVHADVHANGCCGHTDHTAAAVKDMEAAKKGQAAAMTNTGEEAKGKKEKTTKAGKKDGKMDDPDRKHVPCGLAPGDQVGSFCKTTLVICPVVAIIQWRNEIARFTTPGSLRVLVYHGSSRTSDPAELEKADVVLTTYSTIENDYRRYMMPSKVTCKYCERRFYPERLKVHLRFFCGPNAVKSEKLARQQKKRPGATMKHMMQRPQADEDDNDDDDDDDFIPEENTGKDSASGSGSKRRKTGEQGGKKAGKAGTKGQEARGKRKRGKAAEEEVDSEEEDVPLTALKGKGKAKTGKKGQGGDKGSKQTSSKSKKGKGKAGKSVDDEDSDFEPDDEAGEDEAVASAPVGRAGYWSRVLDQEWEDKADKEAAAMIAQALKTGKTGGKGAVNEGAASVLHKVRWRRIILDEAHCIKDRRCSTAKAVFALVSKYKWALSGTPLQNRVAELYSQIRFLRVYPYGWYFCRKCECRSLDYSFFANRKCQHCEHSPLAHFCWWNRHVANPIRNYGYQGKGRNAMLLLKNQIMPRILLRRTKVQCADDLALPPRTLVLRKDRFDEREMDFYEALYTQSQAQFDAYVSSGTILNNYAHIFDLLIRLRQAVDHPYLVVYSNTAAPQPLLDGASRVEEDGNKSTGAGPSTTGLATPAMAEGICTLCHDPVEDPVFSGCKHVFCRACITDFLAAAVGQTQCPTCSRPLSLDLQRQPSLSSPGGAGPSSPIPTFKTKRSSILSRIQAASFQSSTKIEALREELHRMQERDPNAKAIVFSQFTSMLDLIHFRLEQVGFKCVKLEGGMSMDMRERMINTFTHDPDTRVFLMSLKAGGVALNLTAASHVMLMDPWWNPAVEQQAQDRIHRLGQYKPIHVVRFVIGGTIEERILKLQEKKQLVFEGTVGRDMEALGRLTVDDLKFLFG